MCLPLTMIRERGPGGRLPPPIPEHHKTYERADPVRDVQQQEAKRNKRDSCKVRPRGDDRRSYIRNSVCCYHCEKTPESDLRKYGSETKHQQRCYEHEWDELAHAHLPRVELAHSNLPIPVLEILAGQ